MRLFFYYTWALSKEGWGSAEEEEAESAGYYLLVMFRVGLCYGDMEMVTPRPAAQHSLYENFLGEESG